MNFKSHLIKLGCESKSSNFGDLYFLVNSRNQIIIDIAHNYGEDSLIEKNSFIFGEYKIYDKNARDDNSSNSLGNKYIKYAVNVSKLKDPFAFYSLLFKLNKAFNADRIVPVKSFFNSFIEMIINVNIPDGKFTEIYYATEEHFLMCLDEKTIKSLLFKFFNVDKNIRIYEAGYGATPTKVIKKYVEEITDADVHLFASVPTSIISDLEFKEFTSEKEIMEYYSSSAHSENTGSLGSSCMRHSECRTAVGIYGFLNNCSLLTIYNKSNGLINGRCLKWNGFIYNYKNESLENITVLDRFYSIENIMKHTNMFIKYAYSKKYYHMGRQSYGCNTIVTEDKTLEIKFTTDKSIGSYNVMFSVHDVESYSSMKNRKLPYLDNMSAFIYFEKSKKLVVLMSPGDSRFNTTFIKFFHENIFKKFINNESVLDQENCKYWWSRTTSRDEIEYLINTL